MDLTVSEDKALSMERILSRALDNQRLLIEKLAAS